jgi:cell wall assembly regulator SMI1
MSIPTIYSELLDIAALVQHSLLVPPPTTKEEIAALEARLGFALPPELAEVLMISNGSSAPVFGDCGAGFFTVDEIAEFFDIAEGAVQASPGVAKVLMNVRDA